jgi:hypothetical protein
LIGKPPPDDLFQATSAGETPALRPTSTTTRAEVLPDGREHVEIRDAVGDAVGGPGVPDLASLDVWASSESVQWAVTLATASPVVADIYIDLNGQPNAGTPTLLPGRRLTADRPGLTTSPIDGWEYAIALAGPTATLYRTQGMGTYGVVQTFPVSVQGSTLRVTIPGSILHGSPRRWGFQVLVMPGSPAAGALVSDIFDPLEISQADLWKDVSSGKRTDIPFIRIRSK